MKIQPNKRNKQKKMYKEIAMEKTSKYKQNWKNNQRKKQGKQTMRMTIAERKPIVCWLETNAEMWR
jgi:hypothetical protein